MDTDDADDMNKAEAEELSLYIFGDSTKVASLRFEYQVVGQNISIAGKQYKSDDSGCPYCRFYMAVNGGEEHLMSDYEARQDGRWHSHLTSFNVDVETYDALVELVVYYEFQSGDVARFTKSLVVTIRVPKPTIDKPKSGDDVGRWPLFSGSGKVGASIQMHRSHTGTAIPHLATYVNFLGVWSLSLGEQLALGPQELTAKQTFQGITSDWADNVSINVVRSPPPEINAPAAGSVQDTTFELSGTKGRQFFSVQVLKDGHLEDKVGENFVTENDWTCRVVVPPGPISLVAILINILGRTDPSFPRAFKIRPPKLTAVTVTHPNATSVKFEGDGYTGATVQITVVSGPNVTPPGAVEVVNGKWETTATNWPFGTYSLKAIQKVPDNAGGWIESQPFTFSVEWKLPDVSDVTYTQDYQPTFSGKGLTGATVRLANPGGESDAAPNAIVSNGQWSSRPSQVWGPTFERMVHIKQSLDSQWSPNWVEVEVTIAPLAPLMNEPVENGLSPDLSGTCWPGAVLLLKFSDSTTEHPVTNNNGSWTFRRKEPFEADRTYTATLTQTAAQQTSPPATREFTVPALMLQPVISLPKPGDLGRDVTIRGLAGMAGATMQLRDAQFGRPLGAPKVLTAGGDWFIELTGLEFREYTLDAQQTLGGRPSERSDPLVFTVVLLPPEFDVPRPGGKLPRTSELSGSGMPSGRIDVWQQGQDDPLLENIPVDSNGHWKAEVTLPVGETTIRARQFFETQTSKDSPPLTFNVVPAAPFIETPATGEHIGRRVVVSGFGVPGDTVTVRLDDSALAVLGRSPVLEDRTWSVTVTLNRPGGAHGLVAVAEYEGFESDDSAPRSVVLGTYQPSIEVPMTGRWVGNPVGFEGRGRAGIGYLVSWYDPDQVWAADLAVEAGVWQGEAAQSLPGGGHWCRFKQTLTDDADGATVSDWVESGRFDTLPSSSQP